MKLLCSLLLFASLAFSQGEWIGDPPIELNLALVAEGSATVSSLTINPGEMAEIDLKAPKAHAGDFVTSFVPEWLPTGVGVMMHIAKENAISVRYYNTNSYVVSIPRHEVGFQVNREAKGTRIF